MKENTINRRDVLKYVGVSGVAISGSTLPATATTDDENAPSITHTLPYDLKIRNSGTEPVKIVVQFHKGGIGTAPVAEHQSSTLEKIGSSEESNISIDSGNYTVRVKAIFEGSSSVTAEREIAVPEGGIPDYAGISVSVFSTDEVLVSEVNV